MFDKRIVMLIFLGGILAGCAGPKPWERAWSEDPLSPSVLKDVPPPEKTLLKTAQGDSSAKETYPIDLPTVLGLAGVENLEVVRVREEIHRAYAKVLQAKEDLLPQITVRPGSMIRHEGRTQATEGNFLDVDKQRLFAGGEFSIKWEVGMSIYKNLAALQKYEYSLAYHRDTQRRIVLFGVMAYFDLVHAHGEYSVLKEAVELLKNLVEEFKRAAVLEPGYKASLLRTEAELALRQMELSEARRKINTSSSRLAALLHLPPSILLIPSEPILRRHQILPEIEKLTLGELTKEGLLKRPEMEALKHLAKAREWERSAASWSPWIPTIEGKVGVGMLGPHGGSLTISRDYTVGLGWKLLGKGGWLDFGGKREEAKSRYNEAMILLGQAKQTIRREIAQDYYQIQALSESLEKAGVFVKKAKSSLSIHQERLKLGTGVPLEVIEAEQALVRAKKEYAKTLIEYNKIEYRLYLNLGRLKVKEKSFR